MNKIVWVALLFFLCHPLGATAELTSAQKSSICRSRPTCVVGKVYNGGRSPNGSALSVAEVHLGLKDKPDDASEAGCRAADKYNGGVEYWLLDGYVTLRARSIAKDARQPRDLCRLTRSSIP